MNPWIAWIGRLSTTLLVSSYLLTFFCLVVYLHRKRQGKSVNIGEVPVTQSSLVCLHALANKSSYLHACRRLLFVPSLHVFRSASCRLRFDSAGSLSVCGLSLQSFQPSTEGNSFRLSVSSLLNPHHHAHTHRRTHSLHSPAAVFPQNTWKGLTPPETQRGLTCSAASRSGCCR